MVVGVSRPCPQVRPRITPGTCDGPEVYRSENPSTTGPDGLVVVFPHSRVAARRVRYEIARLFQREGHYDFCMFNYPHGKQIYANEEVAYLLVRLNYVVAFAAVRTAKCWGIERKREAVGPLRYTHREPIPLIAGVFVCRDYRQRGIGGYLIAQVCRQLSVEPGELAWQTPFSETGYRLALTCVDDSADLRLGN